MKIIDRKKKSN